MLVPRRTSSPRAEQHENDRCRPGSGPNHSLERLGTLLVYAPEYGIIICKSCRLAIQPSALSNHFLRHGIYREHRQKLLREVAEMDLQEPSQVSLPPANCPAIPYLAVADGYRCDLDACGHLCISQKRMAQHLREQHGTTFAKKRDVIEPVQMQTMFGGNQIRYFQVLPESTNAESQGLHPASHTLTLNGSIDPSLHSERKAKPVSDDSIVHLQMRNLIYLHQYINVTSYSVTRGREPVEFWTRDFLQQAESHTFLMHGVLGAAAFHLAVAAEDSGQRALHMSNGLQHQAAGLAAFRSLIQKPTSHNITALIASARLLGVQHCAQALIDNTGSSLDVSGGRPPISHILDIISLLRGGHSILVEKQELLPHDSPFKLPAEAMQGLEEIEIDPGLLQTMVPHLVNEAFQRFKVTQSTFLSESQDMTPKDLHDVVKLVEVCARAARLPHSTQITDNWTRECITGILGGSYDVAFLSRLIRDAYDAALVSYEQARCSFSPYSSPQLLCYPYIPDHIYTMLVSLPSLLIAQLAGRSDQDLHVFDAALAALVSSFSRSYASETRWARWNGIESWPRMLDEHFMGMIERCDPLALVLVAHWTVLLSRQEKSYWFLDGLSGKLQDILMAQLDAPIQHLVLSNMRLADQ